MHVALPILGGHLLMGTDAVEGMGFPLVQGSNVHLNLEPDSRTETDRLFKALAEDGTVEMPLQVMFWGGYFGSLVDRFGTHWMFNCSSKGYRGSHTSTFRVRGPNHGCLGCDSR